MTPHELDRPAWASLVVRHKAFAERNAGARRYLPSIAPFAASRDDSPESLEALAALVGPGETVVLLQADAIRLPPSLRPVMQAAGIQMLAEHPVAAVEDDRIVPLTAADAAEMLALASLTQPGPFTLRALDIGRFWGIRDEGRLVAMAGERMAQPGHVELSGVCSHPDARGKGLARLLSGYVAGRIAARGDRPYLHVLAHNTAAISLYRSLGFAERRAMHIAAIKRIVDDNG